MICKKCKTEMKTGIAIDPEYEENARYIIAPVENVNIDTLKLIDAWKCPKCGHSEKIDHFKEGVAIQKMEAPTATIFKMKLKN